MDQDSRSETIDQSTGGPPTPPPNQERDDRNGDAPGLVALLESLLFVADEPVTVSRLAQALEVTEEQVEAGLEVWQERYSERGVRLQRFRDRVQLVSLPEAAPFVERFLELDLRSRLSAAALEALAIVAYEQPATRAQVEAVRGVNSDSVLRTLLGKGLIEEVDRLDTVGRPILYGTTFEFLQFFGLETLDDLPDLEGFGESD